MSISSSPSRVARLKTHVAAWVARHLVAVDPHPVLSRLDRLDGLDGLERLDPSAGGQDVEHPHGDRQPVDGSQDLAS